MVARQFAGGTAAAAWALALAAMLHGCSKDEKKPTAPTVTADLTITIVGSLGAGSYSPNPDTLKSGQTVSWRNNDSMAHTATQNEAAFGTGIINPGATSTPVAISTTGSFGYHCEIHPTMTGTLVVIP